MSSNTQGNFELQINLKYLHIQIIVCIFASKIATMTREDFCNLMAEAKTASKISSSELSFQMKMLLATLRRFELGKHNFNLQTVVRYLEVLGASLVITDGNDKYNTLSYDDVLNAYVSIRKTHGITQRDLAPIVNLSNTGVANIESRVSKLTIDVLLKMCEYCNAEIKIVGKEVGN